MTPRQTAAALVVSHLGALGLGYAVTPKQPVDAEVEHVSMFRENTAKVLATTVESLKEENRLLVFSYKGSAKVSAGTKVWIFRGTQELQVPAVVNYYVDLSNLSLADVVFDDRAKLVRVQLPKLIVGDIAFQPEGATTINGGLLTFSDEQVEALRKVNYTTARKAMVAQSQQPGLVNAAKRQAINNIQQYFEIPLRIAGLPDVKVVASFK